MRRKKKRHSLIPEKAQMPLMVGGSIVLVAVLVYQLGFRQSGQPQAVSSVTIPQEASLSLAAPPPTSAASPPPAATTASPAATATVPGTPAGDADVQTLTALLDEVRQYAVPVETPDPVPPALSGNPFSPFVPGSPPEEEWATENSLEGLGQTGEETYRAFAPEILLPEEPGPSPEELARTARLEKLQLTATAQAGAWKMAVINGAHYKVGETVEGFTITSIGEKQVRLQDNLGAATIMISAPNTSTGRTAALRMEPTREVPVWEPRETDVEIEAEAEETVFTGDHRL